MTFRTASRIGFVFLFVLLIAVAFVACQGTTRVGIGADVKKGAAELTVQHDRNPPTVRIRNGTGKPMDVTFLDKNGQPVGSVANVPDGAFIPKPPGAEEAVITCPPANPPTPPPGGSGSEFGDVASGAGQI